MGGIIAFKSFNDGVLRAAGGDAEDFGRVPLRTGGGWSWIGRRRNSSWRGASAGSTMEASRGGGDDGGGVGYGDRATGGVIDGDGGEVLDKGAAAPDVEHLGAEADGEEGLAVVVGVFEEAEVDLLAGWVGGVAGGDGGLGVTGGVYIEAAAGEEGGLAGS